MVRPFSETTILTTLAACGWLAVSACSGTSDSSQDSGVVEVGGATVASGGSTASAGRSGIGGTSTTGGLTTNDTSGGAHSTGGNIGIGGSKATGGTIGTGGATQVASCPLTPPTQGAACGGSSLSCFYDECPNTGRTQATCDSSGTWTVTTAACGTVYCVGYITTYTCSSGYYCRVSAGGAIYAACMQTPCGSGPVTAQCLGAYGCNITTSLTQGVSVYCNTCPPGSGGCA